MHAKYRRANELSGVAITAAIEVHRILGPGLLESVYESCMIHELKLQGVTVVQQHWVDVIYKDLVEPHNLKFDLLLEDCLLLELKACIEMPPIYKAKLLSYMKLLDVPLGLLMNFHCEKMVQGVSRVILRGADAEDTFSTKPPLLDYLG